MKDKAAPKGKRHKQVIVCGANNCVNNQAGVQESTLNKRHAAYILADKKNVPF